MLKPGDLVLELLPLMAGDCPGRYGLIKEVLVENKWYNVLFVGKEEHIHFNSIRKLETFSGNK